VEEVRAHQDPLVEVVALAAMEAQAKILFWSLNQAPSQLLAVDMEQSLILRVAGQVAQVAVQEVVATLYIAEELQHLVQRREIMAVVMEIKIIPTHLVVAVALALWVVLAQEAQAVVVEQGFHLQ
jgi:hypothetical protein